MTAASPLTELESLDGQHFDSGISHLGDGVCVALIGDDDAWLDRDGVVRVVPLLTFLLVLVAACFDDRQLFHAERIANGSEEILLDGDVEVALLLARTQADCAGSR